MKIQVMYRRLAATPDGRDAWQMVSRSVSPADLFGDDTENVIEVRSFHVAMAYDPDHPLEYTPRPALWWF